MIMKYSFLEYLSNHLMLSDGATGTYIYQKGFYIDKCYDALNLSNPELIRTIHKEYLEAGADMIETNTFGANRFKLYAHNLSDKMRDINIRGAEIAREAAGIKYVAGSMGPLGIKIVPWGEISLQATRDAFAEQASVLSEGGVDVFILETFQNLDELEQAILAVRDVTNLPIIAQMAFQEDGRSIYGTSLEEMVSRLNQSPADVIGLNCVIGPKQMLDELEQLVRFSKKPVSVMPNAGLPQYIDGRTFYMSTPDYFGVYAMRFIQSGARLIGGCCGTTPEHIKKMAESLAQKKTRMQKQIIPVNPELHNFDLPDPVPLKKKSHLAAKLAENSYVTLVEMVSPKGRDLSKTLLKAKKLKDFGIDAVNIPDGPRASARMNGMAMAIHLQEKANIETVLHYCCRDRNLLGIQSDLLGASVLGIKNILAITGDPPKMGDYPDATAVFDIDSIGLTRFISNLNHGMDIGCKPIGQPTGFLVGVGVDPNSVNMKLEIERFKQKVDSGAEYVITQPVFDIHVLSRFLDCMTDVPIPVIAGIWPLASLRNAEFMKHEVPGVTVPDAIINRIAAFDSKDDQLKAGIEIAQKIAIQAKSFTRGIQVSAPFGRVDIALDVVGCVI